MHLIYNVAHNRPLNEKTIVLASIEIDSSKLKTVTKAQSDLIATRLSDIDRLLSDAHTLVSYRKRSNSVTRVRDRRWGEQFPDICREDSGLGKIKMRVFSSGYPHLLSMRILAMSAMWSERHRPKMLSECVLEHLDDHSRKLLQEAVTASQLPNVLMYGPPGTGKSTIARILCDRENSLHGEPFQRITIRKIGC